VRIPFCLGAEIPIQGIGRRIRERLRDILTELCEWQEITILEGAIKDDHVHMYLSVPPKHSPSHVIEDTEGEECGVSSP